MSSTAEARRATRIRRYSRVALKAIKANLVVSASILSLGTGGLLLLLYTLSIGQLPEFSWNDLSGTLLATFLTGGLVVITVAGYSLCAGYFARWALESVYPGMVSQQQASDLAPTRGVHLIKGNFILHVSGLASLLWILPIVCLADQRLPGGYHNQMALAAWTAFTSGILLLLVDWPRVGWRAVRGALICLLTGSLVTLIGLLVAWSALPVSELSQDQVKGSAQLGVTFNSRALGKWILANAAQIGVGFVLGTALLLARREVKALWFWVGRKIAFHLTPPLSLLGAWIGERIPARAKRVATQACSALLVSKEGRRLVRAKLLILVAFSFFTLLILFIALSIAKAGDPSLWPLNFLLVAIFIMMLNWASFAARRWRDRALTGLAAAVMMFGFVPLLIHNALMLPNMVVSLLGLGNEHLASVGLSSKQCATLAPYGVDCVPDGDRTITLTHVNLLNRMGGVVVLELLAKGGVTLEKKAEPSPEHAGSKPEPSNATAVISPVGKILNAPHQSGAPDRPDEQCSGLLISRLAVDAGRPDRPTATSLRCIVFTIPKEQVVGSTISGPRTYREGYTSYLAGPVKGPTTVKFVGDDRSLAERQAKSKSEAEAVK